MQLNGQLEIPGTRRKNGDLDALSQEKMKWRYQIPEEFPESETSVGNCHEFSSVRFLLAQIQQRQQKQPQGV